jgi:hypothetical protein
MTGGGDMAVDRAEIQHKIEALKQERDKLVQQANAQVTFLNGKIAGLEELIAPKPEPPTEEANE